MKHPERRPDRLRYTKAILLEGTSSETCSLAEGNISHERPQDWDLMATYVNTLTVQEDQCDMRCHCACAIQ
jgi:hypothetical protein